ncbi:MAG TPA: ABC transporter substrate-binding protein [Chloroflexota bacterium]|nr:ABC transporter substrate-binding protein [Chloroflexota bacterium]
MSSNSRLSRRQLLRSASAAAGLLAVTGILEACGGGAAAPSSAAPTSPSAAAKPASGAPAASASAKPAASGAAAASGKPAASAASAAAKPAAGTPLKLGWLVSNTGVYASIGADMTNGLQLYLDGVNNTAGGRPITVLKEDEGPADGKVALEKGRKLIEQDKVDLLAGVIASPDAAALRDPANDSRTIFLIANAGANVLSRKLKSKYLFRTSFSNWQNCFPAGKWFYDNIGHEAAVMAPDYSAGHEDIDAFKESFTAAGGKVVKEAYPPLGTTGDYSPYLTDVKSANPKGIFAFFAGADALKFVKQYAQFGLIKQFPLLTPGFPTADDVLPSEGKDALGIKSSIHYGWTLDNPENKKFVADYRAKYNKPPSVYALQAYDTGHVIVEALNKTQGDVSDKDKLAEVIQGVKFNSPRGPFSFDPDTNNVVEHIYLFEVKEVNGEMANAYLADLGEVKDPGKP